MDRLFDEEMSVIWAEYYRRRARKDSRILLSALVNIIKGQCLILADRGGSDYSKLLQSTLHKYEIPTDQFWEIEESGSVK
jgi:hypothetical protein